jgi:glycosyltransferase involved in cell wall biosynthesis
VGRPRVLINALSLASGGGGRSYLVNTLHELGQDSRGFDFTVLLDAHDPLAAVDHARVDVARLRLPAVGPARLPLRVLYEEIALPLRAGHFDLLYCPADLAPLAARTPTVVALRNLHIYDQTYYDTIRIRVLERLVRWGVRRAQRIVVPTRAAAEQIAARIGIPAARISIVPHGVSRAPFASDLAAARTIDAKPYLFLPASLERHKRIEVLIRSLQHVADPALEAWIAGGEDVDPVYAAELRRLTAELGLTARVRFLGPVPYHQILSYYRGALALAFPSLLETFGHPTVEAMLAGTPIVAADIPATREIAGDVALYFPPDDALALARAVDRLRDEGDAVRQRVERGLERAAGFSWQRSMDGLCGVFDEVLHEHRGAVSA